MLAGDVGQLVSAAVPAITAAATSESPILNLQSDAGEGEDSDRIQIPEFRVAGVQSQIGLFAVEYNAQTDLLTINSSGTPAHYAVTIVTGEATEPGTTLLTRRTKHTDFFPDEAGFGEVFPGVTTSQNNDGSLTYTIPNALGDLDAQSTTELVIRRYELGQDVFREDDDSVFVLAEPADELSLTEQPLQTTLVDGTPRLQIPALVATDTDFEVVNLSPLGIVLVSQGETTSLDGGGSESITLRFSQAGEVAIRAVIPSDVPPDALDSEFPDDLTFETRVRVVDVLQAGGRFQSQNRLFTLSDFDLAAIDRLDFPIPGVSEQPEVRFGVFEGRVSNDALVGDPFFPDLQVRVSVEVDTLGEEGAVVPNVVSVTTRPDAPFGDETNGRFSLHLEELLRGAFESTTEAQRTSPRLSARFLRFELVDRDGEVIDTLEIPNNLLLDRIERGLNPTQEILPLALDVDFSIDTDRPNLGFGRADIDVDVFLHNSRLASADLPDNTRVRVEIDYGDGTSPVFANVDPRRLSSSARLRQTKGAFGDQVSIRSILFANQIDRLLSHEYQQTGEFEITVTATLPDGQVSQESKTIEVIDFDDSDQPELTFFSVSSHLINGSELVPRIVANLRNFGELFNPADGQPTSFVTVTIDGQSVNASIERSRRLGSVDQVEIDVTGVNLFDFLPTGTDPATLPPLPIRVEFANGGNDNEVVQRSELLPIQVPEIRNLTFLESSDSLQFDVDGGLQSTFDPFGSNDILIEINGLPVEFERVNTGAPPERVTPQLLIAQQNGEIVNLDEQLLRAHFDGVLPQGLENETLISDVPFTINVFSRISNDNDTPLDLQRDEFLFTAQDVTLDELRRPTLKFQQGSIRQRIPLFELVDRGVTPDGFAPVEGRAIGGLLDNVNSRNFDGPVLLVAQDDSVGFAQNASSNELLGEIETGLSGNINPTVVVPLRSGRVGFGIFTLDENGDADQLLESISFNVDRAAPRFSGIDTLNLIPGLQFETDDELDRTVELTLVRGADFFDGSDFSQQLQERRDAGQVILNTVQGEQDFRTQAFHTVRIDWGDGTFDDVDLLPLNLGGEFVTISHTFETEHRQNLFTRTVGRNPELTLRGDIQLTVTEFDFDDLGERILVGPSTNATGLYRGPEIVRFDFAGDPEVASDPEARLVIDDRNDANAVPSSLAQVRKVIAGRPVEGFSIIEFSEIFDYRITSGRFTDFRVFRDGSEANDVARVQFEQPGAQVNTTIPFDRFANRIDLPVEVETEFIDERLFDFTTVGSNFIEIVQVGTQDDVLTEQTLEEKFGRIEVVVFPEIDLRVSGDGTLLGSVVLAGAESIELVRLDDPFTGNAPFFLENEDVNDLNRVIEFETGPGDFLDPGKRARIDTTVVRTVDNGSNPPTQFREVVSRAFTPLPQAGLELTEILFDQEFDQLTGVDIRVQLSESTLADANDLTDDAFRLTISPGGGEDEIVLIRNENTVANELDIEGTDGSVSYDSETGIIDLSNEITGNQPLIRYRNFGTHRFRAFNKKSFGESQITVRDVIPSVLGTPRGTVNGFGLFNIEVPVDSPAGGRAQIFAGDQVVQQTFPAGQETVNLTGISNDVQPGNNLFQIVDNDGDQSGALELPVQVEKEAITVEFDVEIDADNQAFLLVDVNALINVLADVAELTEQFAGQTSFELNLSNGDVLSVSVTARADGTSIAVVQASDSEEPGGDLAEPLAITNDSQIRIPLDSSLTNLSVSILSNEQCIEGSDEFDLEASQTFPQDLRAVAQPNGDTTISGTLPLGAVGPINFSTGDGVDFTIEDVVGGQPFIVNQPGLAPGQQLQARIGENDPFSTTIEQKSSTVEVGIDLALNPNAPIAGRRRVRFERRHRSSCGDTGSWGNRVCTIQCRTGSKRPIVHRWGFPRD